MPLPLPLRVGRFLVSKEQDQAVSHWPSSIVSPDKFLKRMVYLATQHQFNELMNSGSLETPIFIKGVSKGSYNFSLHHVFKDDAALNSMLMPYAKAKQLDKNVSMIINNAKDTDFVAFQPGTPWYCPYREMELISKPGLFNPADGVIVSEVLEISYEDNKRQEFRAFIVSGVVTSLSGYTDYESMPVPSEIAELANEFAKENRDLAPAFVADFGMTDRGPVLIELNGFDFSGRYIDNDPARLYSALRDSLEDHSYTFIEPAPIKEVNEPEFMKAIRANFDDSFSLTP
ncbi:ATP-grasp domain-containing protein (plasmid) [Pseudomonas sp. FeN3W]|nr:ATP-grasp domain-containing protein [Pseudomonas sp. FeN3W]